ncbi:hypothetical protein [Clostridium tunisiense]|uniref:hypothetical protein n=1 Tax=Clostridium tunisiense TaxID=219748 RepID=UPI000300D444|nr:hypothetical protein [Clostridium tunisiense]
MKNLDSIRNTSIDYFRGRQEKLQALSVNTCTGNETVLLIQDNPSWGFNSMNEELEAQGVNFCTISSDQIDSVNLSRFKEIIIPSAQFDNYYANIMPNEVILPSIEAFVRSGGILSANLAWVQYYSTVATFVGGLKYQESYTENNNIANSSHPIITAALPCFGGNCGQIIDNGYRNDLDGWNASSHGYFTNLPIGTGVILTDENNNPVMIEYPYGRGRVIVTFTTPEWDYYFGGRKLLANELAYQSYLVRRGSRGLFVGVE